MKKKLLCFLLCVLLLPLGVMKSAGGDGVTRCLLIGCDRFVSMPDTEPASANNVETMGALLTDFLPGEVRIQRYVNGPGTVEGFERLVRDTFRDANDADTALIYLSTHGLLREESGEERVEFLLSDGESEEYLGPEKLKQILDKIPGDKTLILDTCHSGAVIGCGGNSTNWFEDGSCRVLTSSGALEDSWFWSTTEDIYRGTGYFTAAMDCAMRSSDFDQIDPDGDGKVSLGKKLEMNRISVGTAGEIEIEPVHIEGSYRSTEHCNHFQHFVKCLICSEFVLAHTAAPETLAVQPDVPVADIVANELLQKASSCGKVVVLIAGADILDESVHQGDYPPVDLWSFRIRNLLSLNVKPVHIGVERKERIGIVEGSEELPTHLIHKSAVKL